MLIAGDIGGTNTRLRCSGVPDARYESAAWPRFEDLLRDFVSRCPETIDAACFAVAGPVWQNRAEVTNVGWTVDAGSLEREFGIGRVVVINDFHAIALGVPLLGESDLISLHHGTRDRTQPMAILGAGTGLGEAVVVYEAGGYHVVTTEGGHADFGPQDEEQARLFLWLHERYGHVSWERVVSGMGLENIYRFLGGEELDPAEIAALAAAGDPRAARTFEIFVDCYGAEAGNLALKVLARGGVFLAGGIAAKNLGWFQDGRFVEAFVRKGRFRELMETIPVDLIANEDVGVVGAMEAARRALTMNAEG